MQAQAASSATLWPCDMVGCHCSSCLLYGSLTSHEAFWTGSGPTSLHYMRIALGGGPLGQPSITRPCFACHPRLQAASVGSTRSGAALPGCMCCGCFHPVGDRASLRITCKEGGVVMLAGQPV